MAFCLPRYRQRVAGGRSEVECELRDQALGVSARTIGYAVLDAAEIGNVNAILKLVGAMILREVIAQVKARLRRLQVWQLTGGDAETALALHCARRA